MRIVIQNWQSGLGAAALVMCLSGAAWAQTADESVPAGQTAQAPAQAPAQTTASTPAPQSTAPAATGQKPLETQSHEGFWGQMNPMARKKWVNRQTTPIKERLNEIDQLTAKNANDIRDLDARATAGIKLASDTANTANQTATDASVRAKQAQTQAQTAVDQTGKLNGTVSNLDQYKPVTDAELHFKSGTTALGSKSKEALDQIADQLQGKKGYIVQVQGFNHTRGVAGVAASEKMADSVVRYLVEKKNVPLYRIYKMGYGSARPSDVTVTGGSVVQVTLLQNSLADLGPDIAGSSIGATQPSNTASPGTVASQPANNNQ